MGGRGSKSKKKHNDTRAVVNQIRGTISKTGFHERAKGIENALIGTRGSELVGGDLFAAILKAMKSNDIQELLMYNMSGQIGINDSLDDGKMTQLHLAALLAKPDITRALLSFPEVNVNPTNKDGDTPLISAIRGAESDHICVVMVSIFVRDKRCEIAKANASDYTALGAAVAKGFRESTKLLISGGLLKLYSQKDIEMAIKLAISLDKEALAEVIFGSMNQEDRIAFKAFSKGKVEMEPISELLDDDDETENGSHSDDDGNIPPPDYLDVPKPKVHPLATAIITAPEALGKKITKDCKGRDVHIGSLVQILSQDVVRRANPRIKEEVEFIEGIANQTAFVHDIDEEKDIYIEVMGSILAGHITSKSVQLIDKGPRTCIADGATVAVGYYVKVFNDQDHVEELAKGHGGWKQKMEDCLGRTGKIRNIDQSGDVFVHFSWGERFCFNPKALLPSSAADIEAKDLDGNWIKKGNLVRITDNMDDFTYFQEEVGYAYNDKLLGKHVAIRKLRLFMQHCDVIVIEGRQTYNINPKCLTLISSAQDYNGNEIKVGDFVTVLSEKDEVKSLQTTSYGSWNDEMEKVLGLTGKIVEIEVATGNMLTVLVARVEFNEGSFYLNPKSLRRNTDGKSTKSYESLNSNTGSAIGDDLQVIPRSELAMKKKLGEGGFGVVTTGSWKGTDCAIKQIRTIVTNQMDYEDILRESRIQYNLKHPNIVQLYGISYEGDLWMVMQYINGTNLHNLLFDTNGRTPREKVVLLAFETKIKMALQATNAISYIHGKGYLHNDIKPENMIIEKRTGNLFMCDFGITRFLGQQNLHAFTSKYTSSFGGTLPYIAPECFQKDSTDKRYLRPTFKSDIWSLGVVLTELFLEKELFPDEKSLYLCKLMGDYKQVKATLRTLHPSVLSIIRDSLEVSPDKRPTAPDMNAFFFQVSKKH